MNRLTAIATKKVATADVPAASVPTPYSVVTDFINKESVPFLVPQYSIFLILFLRSYSNINEINYYIEYIVFCFQINGFFISNASLDLKCVSCHHYGPLENSLSTGEFKG